MQMVQCFVQKGRTPQFTPSCKSELKNCGWLTVGLWLSWVCVCRPWRVQVQVCQDSLHSSVLILLAPQVAPHPLNPTYQQEKSFKDNNIITGLLPYYSRKLDVYLLSRCAQTRSAGRCERAPLRRFSQFNHLRAGRLKPDTATLGKLAIRMIPMYPIS